MTNEKTVLLGKEKNIPVQQTTLKKILSRVGLGAAGVAGGIGLSSFFMSMSKSDAKSPDPSPTPTPTKPDIHADPIKVTSVTDDMSFEEAFRIARHEAGANGYFTWHGKVFNTMYREEQEMLTPEERKEMYAHTMAHHKEHSQDGISHEKPVIVIHDEAPEATHVHDGLAFRDAFAIAREEVGPGGVFEWHGKLYNTYTREEFAAMSPQQKHDYAVSIHHSDVEHHDVSAKDVDIVAIDGGDTTLDERGGVFPGEQMLHEEWVDDGTGNKIHVAEFLVNGEHVVKIDQDGDGVFDLTMEQNPDGSIHLQTADGQEADITAEDFAQLQQMGGSEMQTILTAHDDHIFVDHDIAAHADYTSQDDHHLNHGFDDFNNNIV